MMTPAARSLHVFGWYLLAAGAGLMLAPALALAPLGVAADPWVRVVGLLAVALGLYYHAAARAELLAFMRLSVWVRLGVLPALIGFVAMGWVPMPLVVFGVIDAAAAAWTAAALRSMGAALRPLAA